MISTKFQLRSINFSVKIGFLYFDQLIHRRQFKSRISTNFDKSRIVSRRVPTCPDMCPDMGVFCPDVSRRVPTCPDMCPDMVWIANLPDSQKLWATIKKPRQN